MQLCERTGSQSYLLITLRVMELLQKLMHKKKINYYIFFCNAPDSEDGEVLFLVGILIFTFTLDNVGPHLTPVWIIFIVLAWVQ